VYQRRLKHLNKGEKMQKKVRRMVRAMRDEQIKEFEKRKPVEPLIYCCEYHFILKNGKAYKSHPRRSFVKNPPTKVFPRHCWRNSIQYALATGMRYVEGYAYSSMCGWGEHGWCVNNFGNVRDVTWSKGIFYFGVEIPLNYVIEKNEGKTDFLACGSMLGEERHAYFPGKVVVKDVKEISPKSFDLLTGQQPYPIIGY